MQKNERLAVAMTATMLVLAGCGGGGGGGAEPTTISGRVADGYIRGATVFWDCNGDATLNPSEISTTTTGGGAFSIAAAPSSSCQLAAYIPVGAIDEDRLGQPISRPYTLLTPKGNEQFISPLTTLVAVQSAENAISVLDASASVAAFLGVSGNVLSDYIAESNSSSAQRRGTAQVAAVLLQNTNTPGQVSQGLSAGLANVKSLAPSIAATNLTTNSSIEAFLSPLRAFLKPSEPTTFYKSSSDHYAVRPNGKIGLTALQIAAIDSVIKLPSISRVTRYGVIHWEDLTTSEFDEALALMTNRGLLADESKPGVQAVRNARTSFLQKVSAYRSSEIQAANKFFSRDVSTNFQFFVSTTLSEIEAISGAVSFASGLPTPDLRRYRGQPIYKGFLKVTTKPAVKDLIIAMLSAVKLSQEGQNNISSALSKGDAEELSQAEFDSLAEAVDQLITMQKDILKQGDFGLAGKLFGPALKLYGVTQECGQASSECFAASLQIVETIAESVPHVSVRAKGLLRGIRAGFDAYSQGKEYAAATDVEMTDERDRILADWDAKVGTVMLAFKQQEFSHGGYERYFETYDPDSSVPSASQILEAITTKTYTIFNEDTCYDAWQATTLVSANTYSSTEGEWCLNDTRDAWVARAADGKQFMLPNGTWVSPSQATVVVTSDITADWQFGGIAFERSTLVGRTATGFNFSTVLIEPKLEIWRIAFGYIDTPNFMASFGTNYPVGNYIDGAGEYIFTFDVEGLPTTASGTVSIFALREPRVCNGTDPCQGSPVATGVWTRSIVGSNELLRVTFPSGYESAFGLMPGQSRLYVNRAGEPYIREGSYTPAGFSSTDSVYTRSALDALLQGKGLPLTLN